MLSRIGLVINILVLQFCIYWFKAAGDFGISLKEISVLTPAATDLGVKFGIVCSGQRLCLINESPM